MFNTNIFPQIVSFLYSLLIILSFFFKKKIISIENRLFGMLIIGNFCGLILDILAYFGVILFGLNSIFTIMICRSILIYLILWVFTMTVYIYAISNRVSYNDRDNNNDLWKKYSVFKKIIIFSEILICLISLLLPLKIVSFSENFYSTGPATYVIYVTSLVLILFWIYLMLRNHKNVVKKKFYPMYAYMTLGAATSLFQFYNPQMIIITPIETFVTILMYFTIENPDVNMLNEVYKNKELMEQTYEDKYNFLFEMTQEARNPLININRVYNEIKDETNPKIIKDGLSAINNLTRQLDFSINNILNISSFDVQKLKIIENKYDLGQFCNNLSTIIKSEIKNKVEYIEEIPKQLPVLYGDSLKLRQILYSLLNNACKYAEDGTVIFRVNVIEKYDVCRVVFNIIDTGHGIPIEEINEILSSTGELSQSEIEALDKKEFNIKLCQKVIKIMGGNLMIKSNEKSGTEIILTIDQRVYHENEESIINKYANQIANYQKVLIIAQTKDIVNIIKKKLKDNNIIYSHFLNGYDAIDKVKSGTKYDLILIEDEMNTINGFVTMQELKKINNFNTPCVIMLQKDKESIKDNYLEDGFKDYIILSNLDKDLNKIIENDL